CGLGILRILCPQSGLKARWFRGSSLAIVAPQPPGAGAAYGTASRPPDPTTLPSLLVAAFRSCAGCAAAGRRRSGTNATASRPPDPAPRRPSSSLPFGPVPVTQPQPAGINDISTYATADRPPDPATHPALSSLSFGSVPATQPQPT